MRPATQTDRVMEDSMLQFANDPERVQVLGKARLFKRSWIELAEALTRVDAKSAWKGWGYSSFTDYCKKELHLTSNTAAKLVGSYRFLRTSAPKIVEKAADTSVHEFSSSIPSMKAVDFVARATERGAADENTLAEIRRAAFEDGVEAPKLVRRFNKVAFPVSNEEAGQQTQKKLEATARRLAALLGDASGVVPREVASTVEQALGQLLDILSSDKSN